MLNKLVEQKIASDHSLLLLSNEQACASQALEAPKGVVCLLGSNNLLDPANAEERLASQEDKSKLVALLVGPAGACAIWPSKPGEACFKLEGTALPPKVLDNMQLMARCSQPAESMDATNGQARELGKWQLNESSTPLPLVCPATARAGWPLGRWSLHEQQAGMLAPLTAAWPGKAEPQPATQAMAS